MYSIISATRPLATSRLWRRRTWSLPPPPRAPQEPVPPPTRPRPPGRAQPPRSTRWSSLSPCPPQRRASARRLPNSSDYWSRWEHIHLFLNWICLCILRNIRWEPNFYFFMLFFFRHKWLIRVRFINPSPLLAQVCVGSPSGSAGGSRRAAFQPPPHPLQHLGPARGLSAGRLPAQRPRMAAAASLTLPKFRLTFLICSLR